MIDHQARQLLFQRVRDKQLAESIRATISNLKAQQPDKTSALSAPLQGLGETADSHFQVATLTLMTLQNIAEVLMDIRDLLDKTDVPKEEA